MANIGIIILEITNYMNYQKNSFLQKVIDMYLVSNKSNSNPIYGIKNHRYQHFGYLFWM